jgi:hypothetical protein
VKRGGLIIGAEFIALFSIKKWVKPATKTQIKQKWSCLMGIN